MGKDNLPSALLQLLSAQRALVPGVIQLTNVAKPKDLAFPPLAPLPPLPPLPLDSLDLPDNIKAHLLQQAFMQNNNVGPALDYKPKVDEPESDNEFDDTDDIVLPEEGEPYFDTSAYPPAGTGDVFDVKDKLRRDGNGNSSDDASRQFECRHCGKRYRWKSTLRRHENVECGGKAPSHQCPYCSYKAKQRGNLGVHIRKHHNTEWCVYASSKVRRNKKTAV